MLHKMVSQQECPKDVITLKDVKDNEIIAIALVNSWEISESWLQNSFFEFIASFANEMMNKRPNKDEKYANAILELRNRNSKTECYALFQIFGSGDFRSRAKMHLAKEDCKNELSI